MANYYYSPVRHPIWFYPAYINYMFYKMSYIYVMPDKIMHVMLYLHYNVCCVFLLMGFCNAYVSFKF